MAGLSRKEVLGFISLALIVLAILGAGFIAKDCRGGESGEKPVLSQPSVIEGSENGDEDYNNYSGAARRRSGGSASRAGGKRKAFRSASRSRGSSRAGTKEKDPIIEYDPFADTIPVDFDDEEIDVDF